LKKKGVSLVGIRKYWELFLLGRAGFLEFQELFLPNSGLRRYSGFRPLIWNFRLIALLFIKKNENCGLFCTNITCPYVASAYE
jgi:hypothetical protein